MRVTRSQLFHTVSCFCISVILFNFHNSPKITKEKKSENKYFLFDNEKENNLRIKVWSGKHFKRICCTTFSKNKAKYQGICNWRRLNIHLEVFGSMERKQLHKYSTWGQVFSSGITEAGIRSSFSSIKVRNQRRRRRRSANYFCHVYEMGFWIEISRSRSIEYFPQN